MAVTMEKKMLRTMISFDELQSQRCRREVANGDIGHFISCWIFIVY